MQDVAQDSIEADANNRDLHSINHVGVRMESSGSFFIDRSCAELAVNMCLPMITESMNDHEVCGSGFLYIVVMDPALNPANATFRDAILYEHAVGDRSKWDADYGEFA